METSAHRSQQTRVEDGLMWRMEVCSDQLRTVLLSADRSVFDSFIDEWKSGVTKFLDVSGIDDSAQRCPLRLVVEADTICRVSVDRC